MISNQDAQFIGVEDLVHQHKLQIESFQIWAAKEDWIAFHNSHYDWWTFPIDKPSSYGFAYTVYSSEIKQLSQIETFMLSHCLGARLLLQSWGWNWLTNQPIENPGPNQQWANWPIRLAKCSRSMWLFDQEDEWQSCVRYAEHLEAEDTSFYYNGRDLLAEILQPQDF